MQIDRNKKCINVNDVTLSGKITLNAVIPTNQPTSIAKVSHYLHFIKKMPVLIKQVVVFVDAFEINAGRFSKLLSNIILE